MARHRNPTDARYDSLASPLHSAGWFVEATQEALLQAESSVLAGTTFRRRGLIPPRRGTQWLRVGDLEIIAGKTTPVLSSNSSPGFSCFMAMPASGGFTTRDGARCEEVRAGDVYWNQNYYGTSTIGDLSSLFFALDRQRLDRSLRSISGGVAMASLPTSLVISGGARPCAGAARLWSLMSLIDQLHGEHACLPSCLGLDEQFYRLLALSLLEAAGRLEPVRKHWANSATSWTPGLDELVDYIRAHAHRNLTLTDLEERSRYSARHLQSLFKQRFNCTPMQFVRRQRLTAAMQQLQSADCDDTVTAIARRTGYRYLSTFTQDFQREFGITPSVLLRASRGLRPLEWCKTRGL